MNSNRIYARTKMKCMRRLAATAALRCALTSGLVWSGATATAQTFTTLKSFGVLTNFSGFNPNAPLVQGPDGTLYGTTSAGEGNINGTVFRVGPDGSGFAVLKWFTNVVEGAQPFSGLTLSGDMLYGTTSQGGHFLGGTVFKVRTNGTGFAVLKEFSGVTDGADPYVALTLSGSVLYGTTTAGGSTSSGTVFKLNTDGTGFTVLKDYNGSDGANPYNVILSGNVLYGATFAGGNSGNGTIFQMNTDGTGYTVLKYFDGTNGTSPSALTLSGNVLYGTTDYGGSSDAGTVFKLNLDGTGFAVLKEFSAPAYGSYTNSDGAEPGPLVLSGGVLYGATFEGGISGVGVVFKLNVDGTDFSVLKHFAGNSSGGEYGLTLSGSTLFGALQSGGVEDYGTLFRLNTDGSGYAVFKEFTYEPDGAVPTSITIASNVLYGTTSDGGSNRTGTIFKLNPDGTGYGVLKEFSAMIYNPSTDLTTNEDGSSPTALVVADNVIYGTAASGGPSFAGTVFKMNTDGSGFAVLKTFAVTSFDTPTNADGIDPQSLIVSSNVLYGLAFYGGPAGAGTIFRLNTDGTGFTVLKQFNGNDGNGPWGPLNLSGGVLYGITRSGGPSSGGTVFKLNSDGTGFAILKGFSGLSYGTNAEGTEVSGVSLSGNRLYGTAQLGGSFDRGTMFKLNTDGTDFTVLKHFNGVEGDSPAAPPVISGNKFFATTLSGGSVGQGLGTVVRMNTDGAGFVVLKRFGVGPAEEGDSPGSIILSGGALYGTTSRGSMFNRGTVFRIDLAIPLNIQSLGDRVVLAWSDPSFSLEAAPTAMGVYTNVPGAASPFTNTISGSQAFFRLSGN